MIKVISIVLIVLTVFLFYGQFMQSRKVKTITDQLTTYLMEGKYDDFEEMIHDKDTVMDLSEYTICYLKFIKEILRDNKKKADWEFMRMDQIKATDKQVAAFYTKAMPYYVSCQDNERCEHCYNMIMALKGYENVKKVTGRFYRIFILKDNRDKEELIKEREHANPEEKELIEKMLKKIEQIENSRV